MFFLGQIIPKYKEMVESIRFTGAADAREAQMTLWRYYDQFKEEYKLNLPWNDEYYEKINGTQLHKDMIDTQDFFFRVHTEMHNIAMQEKLDGMFSSWDMFYRISDWISSPWTIAMVAVVLPIVAYYAAKLWVYGLKEATRSYKVAGGVTIAGIVLMMLLAYLN